MGRRDHRAQRSQVEHRHGISRRFLRPGANRPRGDQVAQGKRSVTAVVSHPTALQEEEVHLILERARGSSTDRWSGHSRGHSSWADRTVRFLLDRSGEVLADALQHALIDLIDFLDYLQHASRESTAPGSG